MEEAARKKLMTTSENVCTVQADQFSANKAFDDACSVQYLPTVPHVLLTGFVSAQPEST